MVRMANNFYKLIFNLLMHLLCVFFLAALLGNVGLFLVPILDILWSRCFANFHFVSIIFLIFLSFPFLSFPFLSFPFPSLPFPSLPFPSLPFPSLPFPSLPFPSFPFLSFPFLFFPFLSCLFSALPFNFFPSILFPFPILSVPFCSFEFQINQTRKEEIQTFMLTDCSEVNLSPVVSLYGKMHKSSLKHYMLTAISP